MQEKIKNQATAAPVRGERCHYLRFAVQETGIEFNEREVSPFARHWLDICVEQILEGTLCYSQSVYDALNDAIKDIDEKVSTLLNEVMPHPQFRELEEDLCSLQYLTNSLDYDSPTQVDVLIASKEEVQKDLERGYEQSALYKKIYTESYDRWGAVPFLTLVTAFEYDNHPQDMKLIRELAKLSGSVHCATLGVMHPNFFGVKNFAELESRNDITGMLGTPEYTEWRTFQALEAARNFGIVVGQAIARLPYGPRTLPADGLNFVENVNGKDGSGHLFMKGNFVFCARIAVACDTHNWPAAICGVRGGGLVQDLSLAFFQTDFGDVEALCPTEIALSDEHSWKFVQEGFIPLVHRAGTNSAVFPAAPSCRKVGRFGTSEAQANAELETHLTYSLITDKMAHTLKAELRDGIGEFASAEEVKARLQNVLKPLICDRDDAGHELKAQHPFREARVEVFDVPGKPGWYHVVGWFRPHFQVQQLSTEIRVVAEIPPPATRS